MSQYSHLTIINGTSYDFIKGYHHSYQMDDWDSAFPDTILSGNKARVGISFQDPLFGSWRDDGGEQVYSLRGAAGSFEIRGRSLDDGYHLWVDPTNLQNDGRQHLAKDMGWHEDSELYIWISGSDDGYIIRTWWSQDES